MCMGIVRIITESDEDPTLTNGVMARVTLPSQPTAILEGGIQIAAIRSEPDPPAVKNGD